MAHPADNKIYERWVYPPVNECIYCGAKNVPLTDEHPVPEGLGGRQILPKACCKTCQKIINEEFEQHCLRTLFSNIRAVLGIKGTRKRKPVRHSIKIITRSGETKRIYRDPAQLPPVFALPMYPEPFFMSGQQPSATYRGAMWKYVGDPKKPLFDELDAFSIIPEPTTARQLARFIAKMAHSLAWARYGPIFEPFLPPIILGQNKLFIEYVGGSLVPHLPEPHSSGMFRCWIKPGTDDKYLVATFRLFARLDGSPIYHAVVGKLLGPWPPEGRPDPQAKP